jgi:hypothetical protein
MSEFIGYALGISLVMVMISVATVGFVVAIKMARDK